MDWFDTVAQFGDRLNVRVRLVMCHGCVCGCDCARIAWREYVCVYRDVTKSNGMWPESPNCRNVTRPDGWIVSQVIDAWFNEIRSHASGGICKALHRRRKTKMSISNLCLISFVATIISRPLAILTDTQSIVWHSRGTRSSYTSLFSGQRPPDGNTFESQPRCALRLGRTAAIQTIREQWVKSKASAKTISWIR